MKQPVLIITQTFPPRRGGMEMVMAGLARRFGEQGHEVQILTEHQAPASQYYQSRHAPAPKFLRPWLKRQLAKRYLATNPIIICDSWKSMDAVPGAADNIILLAHGQEYLNKQAKAQRINRSLKRANLIVASSQATADMAIEFAQQEAAKLHVIHPTYMLQKQEIQAKHNANLQILSLARLEKRKGLAPSMAALAQLDDQLPDYQWHIAGDGPERVNLEQLAMQLGLKDKIMFHGFVDEAQKHELMSRSDLFLMPSYQEGNSLEGFGIVYAEAASYAIPAIGGMAGGASEAVLDGQTGWSVDGTSMEAIATALISAMGDNEERRKRGQKARQYFEEHFEGDASFNKFYQLATGH